MMRTSIKCKLKQKEFKKYMAKYNKSQNDLAIILGISSAFMSQIITGKRNIGPYKRQQIMDEFMIDDWNKLFEVTE